jgi:membrane associated rhomboid family serine protease
MMFSTQRLARQPVHPILLGLVAVMVGIEGAFILAENGIVDLGLQRYRIYAGFAFHDPLFEFARATGIVPLQLLWSFVTHAFLHGDILHLGLNMAALLGLGHAVSRIAGIWVFLLAFVLSAIGGALTFALISDFPGPLVGASGAIFGLLAMLTAWQDQYLRHHGLPRTEVRNRILGLVAINAALHFGLGGMLAWEAHLGGFIAGWLVALIYPPRPQPAPRRQRQTEGY